MVIKWIVIAVCVYILIGVIYAYRFMSKELPEFFAEEMHEDDEYFTEMNQARNESHVYMEELNQELGKKGSKVIYFLTGTLLWLPLVIDTEVTSRREATKWREQYSNEDEWYDLDDEEVDPRRFPCPCCGYPTLEIQIYGYEVCILCGWEDDGQRNDQANEVWGGPNQNYSLTHARKIFKKHCIGYYYNEISKPQKREAIIHANKLLIAAYDQLEKPEEWTTEGIVLGTDKQWEEVFHREAALDAMKYGKK